MATPRKSDKDYPGYLADQTFILTAREKELLSRTVHVEEYNEVISEVKKSFYFLEKRLGIMEEHIETLEVQFNMLCNMLNVQLANSGFLTLKIMEAEK